MIFKVFNENHHDENGWIQQNPGIHPSFFTFIFGFYKKSEYQLKTKILKFHRIKPIQSFK